MNEVEDGMGFSGLVPDASDAADDKFIKKLASDNALMRASILHVLALLKSQDTFNPSLLVIRECIRELRRYELL